MTTFRGILNDNGFEREIHIHLNNDIALPYETETYIDNVKYNTKIYSDRCQIGNTVYKIYQLECGNEILIIGKELRNFLYFFISCIFRPKFFILTNKKSA